MHKMKIKNYLILFLLFSCSERPKINAELEGKPMPSFDIKSLDSTSLVRSTDIPVGRPVVLFYFSTSCPYCRAQTNELIKKMDVLKHISFYLVTNESFVEMRHYEQKFNIRRFSNVVVAQDYTGFLESYFKINKVPYMAIYNKNKKLVRSFLGKVSISTITKTVK